MFVFFSLSEGYYQMHFKSDMFFKKILQISLNYKFIIFFAEFVKKHVSHRPSITACTDLIMLSGASTGRP